MKRLFPLKILLLLVAAGLSNAATYFVRTDGNDANDGLTDDLSGAWQSVQKALDSVGPGDIVMVSEGTYIGAVTTGAAGAKGNKILVQGTGNPEIIGRLAIQHSYIKFTGLTFKNSPKQGIYISGPVREVTIEECEIEASVGKAIQCVSIGGSDPQFGPQDLLIKNSIVRDPGHNAIELQGENAVVDGCKIISIGGDAFRFHGRGHIIRNNFVNGMGSDPQGHPDCFQSWGQPGVQNRWSKNILIEDNYFYLPHHKVSSDAVSFNNNSPANDTVTRNSGSFIDDGVQVGEFLNVCNPENDSNEFLGNGLHQIQAVTDSTITLDVAGVLTNHANDSSAVVVTFGILQPCQLDDPNPGATDNIVIRRNVFDGVSASGTCQFTNTHWINNTFVNASMTGSNCFKYSAGGGGTVKNNLFWGCGRNTDGNGNDPARGWYNVAEAVSMSADYNYVASADFTAKSEGQQQSAFEWKEENGINGGNPGFVDPDNSLGPDGKPFTSDDGLRLSPGSILIGSGEAGVDIGAHRSSAAPARPSSLREIPTGE